MQARVAVAGLLAALLLVAFAEAPLHAGPTRTSGLARKRIESPAPSRSRGVRAWLPRERSARANIAVSRTTGEAKAFAKASRPYPVAVDVAIVGLATTSAVSAVVSLGSLAMFVNEASLLPVVSFVVSGLVSAVTGVVASAATSAAERTARVWMAVRD